MNIQRSGSNPLQLGLQNHHMQTSSPRMELQTSPFDANASAYREDTGATDLGSGIGRRGFLVAGLATLVGAGCSKKTKTQTVTTKPGKDPKAVAHDRKTPITLPPDGVGDMDGIDTWRRTQKPSASAPFPWGKVALISAAGVFVAGLLTVGTLALLRRRKRFNAITGDELQYVMQPLEWHDTGTQVQVKLTEPKENGDLDHFVDGTEAKLIRKLAEERAKNSGRKLLKPSTWGKGPKEYNFKMSDALAAIEVTNPREVEAVREVLEDSGIKRGWFVRDEEAGDDMYTFKLTRYKRPWWTKKAIAEGKAALQEPANADAETVGATEGSDAAGQSDVKIDQHAVAMVEGEGYYIHSQDKAAHLYPQAWQQRVIDAITDVVNGKSLQFLTDNCAKRADKNVTQDQVRQLLRDIGSMGVLAPNSEIHDEYLIVAPVAERAQVEAKLGNDKGVTIFRPSKAAPSQDQGQSSNQNTMATPPGDADAQADSVKQPPYYKGEPGKITEIVLKDRTLTVPYGFRSALSLCAGSGGCSLKDLKDMYGALEEKQFVAFYKFLNDYDLADLEMPMNSDAPIIFLMPSMDDAPVRATEDETRAGVEPPSLDNIADGAQSEMGFTDAMMAQAAAAGKAAPMGPPPRAPKSAPTPDSGPAPKVADETGPTDYVKPDDILGVPAAATSSSLGDPLKLDYPGDSAANMPPIQFEFTGLDAAILRLSMETSLNAKDVQRIVEAGLAPDQGSVLTAAQELADDNYLHVEGNNVTVDPYWRPHFPDVPVAPAKPTRPQAPKPPKAPAAEPEVPADTTVDAGAKPVDDAHDLTKDDAEATPPPAPKPSSDTDVDAEGEPVSDADVVGKRDLNPVEAAEAELEAAQQEFAAAEQAQEQAVARLQRTIEAVAVAEGAFEAAKADAQAKAAATYEAETEEAEQQAGEAAAEAQRTFARKRAALKDARDAQEAAQEALDEATARQRAAGIAQKQADATLDAAHIEARAAAVAKAQAEAEAQARAEAERKAAIAEARAAAAESAEHVRQHGRAGDTVVESGATPGKPTAEVVKEELPPIKPKNRRLATSGPRKPSDTVVDSGANPAKSTAQVVREELPTPPPTRDSGGQASSSVSGVTISSPPTSQTPQVDQGPGVETDPVQDAYDKIMDDMTITVPAKVGIKLKKLLDADEIEYSSQTTRGKMTITIE